MRVKIQHGDSREILPTLEDKSFDAVIIDPPYNMQIDYWDSLNPGDIKFYTKQFKRIGKEFYAFFGQMPYIRAWDKAAEAEGFYFLEHVVWVKRNCSPSARLSRSHESIYIYSIGSRKKFYEMKGRYEDVKIPGILVDVTTLDSIHRHMSSLRQEIREGKKIIIKADTKNNEVYSRLRKKTSIRSPEYVNFSNVWSFKSPKNAKHDGIYNHPTEKNLEIIMRLAEMLTNKSGKILDCFSGSGTTAIACKQLGRECLCIEKDKTFYDKSVIRLKEHTWQTELFND